MIGLLSCGFYYFLQERLEIVVDKAGWCMRRKIEKD